MLSVRGSPAALTMMNTFKLCSTCLQKSPFANTSKAFFPPLVQWYIHAGRLYLKVGSVTLLVLTTMQPETSFVITYKKKIAFHGNVFVVCDIGIVVWRNDPAL